MVRCMKTKRTRSRRRLGRPAVWLATLSTVVGIATGMFTLRDQIAPGESGSARASLADYQTSIGEVCLAVNEAESARARDARALAHRLPRADSVATTRELLLRSTNRRVADLVDDVSMFGGVSAPKANAREHVAVSAAWKRNLARIRAYGHRLDGVVTRGQLAAAADVLYRQRVPLTRDGLTVRTGLVHLGGRHCHLDKPITTPNVCIPALCERHSERRRPRPAVAPKPAPAEASSSVPTEAAPEPGDEQQPRRPSDGSDSDSSDSDSSDSDSSDSDSSDSSLWPAGGSGTGAVTPPSGSGNDPTLAAPKEQRGGDPEPPADPATPPDEEGDG